MQDKAREALDQAWKYASLASSGETYLAQTLAQLAQAWATIAAVEQAQETIVMAQDSMTHVRETIDREFPTTPEKTT